jgi:hypothetical protein
VNLVIDLIIALGFLITAVTGVYLLFVPSGYQGGVTAGWDPNFLFSRVAWDLLHTWAGVIMSVAVTLHFVIHWRWVVNVTRRFFQLPGSVRHVAVQNQEDIFCHSGQIVTRKGTNKNKRKKDRVEESCFGNTIRRIGSRFGDWGDQPHCSQE